MAEIEIAVRIISMHPLAVATVMGYGGMVGAGFERALTSSLTLVPEFRLSAQRVERETLAFAIAQISLGVG